MGLRSWSWRRIALLWIAGVALELGVIYGGRIALDALTLRSLETLENLPGIQQQELHGSSTLDVRDSASVRSYTWTLDRANAEFQRYERLDTLTDWLMRVLAVVLLVIPGALVGITAVWLWRRRSGEDGSRLAAT